MSKNIVSIKNLHKEFSGKTILEKETFGFEADDKIGLLGKNGCGKSTFLNMLTGRESIDGGSITFRNDVSYSYLPQIPELPPQLTIYEQIYHSSKPEFKLLRTYFKITKKLEEKSDKCLRRKQKELIKQLDALDAWEIEVKAKKFLTKLGFKNLNRKTSQLSGGEKRRIDMARVLMDQPDLLILDEPTNHLDIETIEWLQDYLQSYKGSLIFVTHDRYFLDVVCTKIMQIKKGKIRFYKGNYSEFLEQKELEKIDKVRKETRRKAQLKKELKWLKRGAKARTSKPKDHIDRVKELLDKSYLDDHKELDISFQTKRMGKSILAIHNLTKKYNDKVLFKNFTHIFQKHARIGIIGANGSGKTTLLKIIAGRETPTKGRIKVGKNTHFAYFQQDYTETNTDISVINYIKETAEHIRTRDGTLHSASQMLKKFLFDKKMQQMKVSSLSGGERKRLYLLKSLMMGSNFIILDEPTNDLDIETLEILEDYLDKFPGCILIVSHDRYFLDRVVDYLFILEDKEFKKFVGNYSDYLLVKRYKSSEARKLKNRKPRKKRTQTKLSYKDKVKLEELKKDINLVQKQQNELEKTLEEQSSQLTPGDFKKIADKIEKTKAKLDRLTLEWIELEEKKERLEK